MVAGVSAGHAREIAGRQKLLDLFVSHTGMCLYVHGIKQAQTRRLQEERIEASITMARKVVHEVNNPLGIIKNYLKILGLKLPEKHPAQAELGVIGEEIDRVGQIIRSLKDFSTPATDALEILDINRMLKDILAIVDSSILKPAMIRLEFTPDPSAPGIRTEKNSLKQVVINLVKNAAEAMPEGGNIHVSTQFHDAASQDPGQGQASYDRVEILIRDDGPGIPEDISQHLFEPFHSTKKEGHSGLGLSIVHNIVSRLGGSISCETAPQAGTTFKITLPAISEERRDTRGG
jgi:signal transduction histidine kinase